MRNSRLIVLHAWSSGSTVKLRFRRGAISARIMPQHEMGDTDDLMDLAREQLQRIEQKLDRILDEANDLKLRMSLIEQRLTIFDVRLDRLEVRMDKIDRRVDRTAKQTAPAPAAEPIVRTAPNAPMHEREPDGKWFESHLQQQLEDDRRYRAEESSVVPHRATFRGFDRS